MKAKGERRKAKGTTARERAERITTHGSRSTLQALVAALTVSVALLLGGCDYLPFGYTSIKEITAEPVKFEGQEVKVKGKVKSSLKLLGMQTFTLEGDAAEIAVTTAGDLPKPGSEVAIKGTVKSAAIIGGTSMGLRIEETKRLR